MLRLNPTQIKLQEKDYKWHKPRYEHRQELRANVAPADITNKLRKSPNKYNDSRTGRRIPQSVLEQAASKPARRHVDQPDTSLYSNEPVPTGSRAFWDKVLAEAGTPTRTKATSLGNAKVFDPSDEFLDTTHSSRVSIEDDIIEGQHDIDYHNDGGQCNHTQSSRAYHAEDEHPSLQQTTEFSGESNSSEPDEGPPVSKSHVPNNKSKHRLSWLPFHRKNRRPAIADAVSDVGDRRSSSSVAVDGPSDRHYGRFGQPSRDSDTEMESGEDGLSGSDNRPIVSTNLDVIDRDAVRHESMFNSRAQPERPSLSSVSGRRPPENFRHHSGHLPRSSLHISQAAASSSPDVLQTNPAGRIGRSHVSESPGLLAFSPRRPRRYRPRSETYPYEESGDFDGSTTRGLDASSSAQTITTALPSPMLSNPPIRSLDASIRMVPTEFSSRRFNAPHPEASINAPYGVSPIQVGSNYTNPASQDAVQLAINRSMSSIESRSGSVHSHPSSQKYPAPSSRNLSPLDSVQGGSSSTHPTPSPRNLSPFATEFVPGARRNLTPHYTLPPPFSATPRNVSSGLAFPSSSPIAPHTPPQRRTGQRVPSIAEVASPRSPIRIPVYDDSRSPTNQPQTPAGLRRNGLPVMTIQPPFGPRHQPATAPARPRGGVASTTNPSTSGTARVADWQAYATPTRRPTNQFGRPFDVYDEERENEGRMTGEERAWRRDVMLRQPAGISRDQMERMEGGFFGEGRPRDRDRGEEMRELRGEEWGS